MSKRSNGRDGDGSNVDPRRDDDSALVPPDHFRGPGSPLLAAAIRAWPALPVLKRPGPLAVRQARRMAEPWLTFSRDPLQRRTASITNLGSKEIQPCSQRFLPSQ